MDREQLMQLLAGVFGEQQPMDTQFGFDGGEIPEGLLGQMYQPQGLLGVMPEGLARYYDTPSGASARIIPPEFSFKPKVNPFKGDYGFRATMKW